MKLHVQSGYPHLTQPHPPDWRQIRIEIVIDNASCVFEKPAELHVLASPEVVSFVEEMFPDLDALEILQEFRRLGDEHHRGLRQQFH